MKYSKPQIKIMSEHEIEESVKVMANSSFEAGGCLTYGLYSQWHYNCDTGAVANYDFYADFG
ncbi:MAG: hypothetical protein E7388_06845 [Ruminococcaceae bacterium]|nr:hypothetical protein [Oscillospiraceae bacterium]